MGLRPVKIVDLMTAHLQIPLAIRPSLSSWRCLGDARNHAQTHWVPINTGACPRKEAVGSANCPPLFG